MSKTAIVTGASRGIGRAIALKLAEEGWCVADVYKRQAVIYHGYSDTAHSTPLVDGTPSILSSFLVALSSARPNAFIAASTM